MEEKDLLEYIRSLDELSLYLELMKIEAALTMKKYSFSMNPGEDSRMEKDIKENKKIISLYEEQIKRLGMDSAQKKENWENTCKDFLNQLSILEYTVLTEEKDSHHNLYAFYPKASEKETFLSANTREKIKENIKTRKIS